MFDTNHSIDLNSLTEKLKKLQQQNNIEPSEPIPSSHSPTKLNLKYTKPVINSLERDHHRVLPPPKKSLPRSVSSLDKNSTSKKSPNQAERSISQLIKKPTNDVKKSQIFEDEEIELTREKADNKDHESAMSQSMRCNYSSKQIGSVNSNNRPVNLLRNSLNVNSSMKQTIAVSRKMSESLRSDSASPSSSCDSSRSNDLSFRSNSTVSSCSSK